MIKLMKGTFFKEAETKAALVRFIAGASILSMGAESARFEKAFAAWQGRRHAVFVNSGSSANLILLQALLNLGRLKRGDRIGISALTWATNIMPIIQLGMVPVSIDCERDTLNISLRTLKAHGKGIDALFLTNVLGLAGDLHAIAAYAKKQKVLLLEDNCEALGSKVGGTLLGNFGLASTFSFFVGHHLSTVEGGMVCTDDEELYHELVMVRAHGWDRNLPEEKQAAVRKQHGVDEFLARYSFYTLGFNVRPTDMQGFLGTHQLRFLDEVVELREKRFKRFHEAIAVHPALFPLAFEHMDVVSSFAIPVIARTPEAFQMLRKRFEDAGVEIRPIIAGDVTKQPFYKKHVKNSAVMENADFIHRHAFYFTNDPALTASEVALLLKVLRAS